MKWYTVFTQAGAFVASVLAFSAIDAIKQAIDQRPEIADSDDILAYRVVEIKS
jgi:hypothetical protein